MNILLHMCCGPCSIIIIESMLKDKNNVTGFFFNPNIHPLEEHKQRRVSAELLCESFDVPLIIREDYSEDIWRMSLSDNKKSRCAYCYTKRLEETAREAKERGFDAFSTSLLISPYQDQDYIRIQGERLKKKYGIIFIDEDYTPFFRESGRRAREIGLYMQKYCGCYYSYFESDHKKKPEYFK